ncbi:hypothetical protein AB4Z40_32045 [Bosea sp. 2YAB26]|uniref:hypothetical protein n=1 Tax=Bosea sp. 2YAB26 TaxID=3237478 RepID=UPI003F8FAC7A
MTRRTLTVDTDALLAALDIVDASSLLDAHDVGRLYGVARRLADAPGALPNLDEADAFDGLHAEGFKHCEIVAIESLIREMRRGLGR